MESLKSVYTMNKRLTSIPLNLADFKKYTQTFRTKLEQIEYLVENKLVVQNELEQNKNIGGNNLSRIHS